MITAKIHILSEVSQGHWTTTLLYSRADSHITESVKWKVWPLTEDVSSIFFRNLCVPTAEFFLFFISSYVTGCTTSAHLGTRNQDTMCRSAIYTHILITAKKRMQYIFKSTFEVVLILLLAQVPKMSIFSPASGAFTQDCTKPFLAKISCFKCKLLQVFIYL